MIKILIRRALEENLIAPSASCQIRLRGPLYDKNNFSMSKDAGLLSITGPELHTMGVQKALSLVKSRIGNKRTYLTFDIDFIDPAFAPGTGIPEAGGGYWLRCNFICSGININQFCRF